MRKAKGFTLAELLVVVAILAILVAVSIPIFSGKIKETEETVCLTNQASLQHALVIEMMYNDSFNSLKEYYYKNKDQYKCPSKNGKIIYSIINDEIKVSCTKHGEVTPAQLLELAVKELINSTNYKIDRGTRVDSNAPDVSSTPKAQLLRKYLESSSFNELDAETWTVSNNNGNYLFIWSKYDITGNTSSYSYVPTICYDKNQTNKYTVGNAEVAPHENPNNNYNVLAGSTKNSNFENSTYKSEGSETKSFATLAEAQEYCNSLKPIGTTSP